MRLKVFITIMSVTLIRKYFVEDVSVYIAHMCVIDTLIMKMTSFNYKKYLKRISLRNTVLDDIRYRV